MSRRPRLLPSADSLLEPDTLRRLLDGSGAVAVDALPTLGYSGSEFFRVTIEGAAPQPSAYVVKRTVLSADWFSHRTRDRIGREAAVLSAPRLAGIHDIFSLPYEAVGVEEGRFALLMQDVSDWLLPDERTPLDRGDEELILETLARLHATYWQAPELNELDWLHRPEDFLYIMGPLDHDRENRSAGSARRVNELIRTGWREALELLPDATREALCRPPAEIAASWAHLPATLIHGDTKVANFALLPGSRVCALDWAFAGRAPCTFEIGWYLAVNSSRLSESKERTLLRYRSLLEAELEEVLDDAVWGQLEEAGIVCGALMLLWAKGAAVAGGRPGAEAEWAWWEDRLAAWARE